MKAPLKYEKTYRFEVEVTFECEGGDDECIEEEDVRQVMEAFFPEAKAVVVDSVDYLEPEDEG